LANRILNGLFGGRFFIDAAPGRCYTDQNIHFLTGNLMTITTEQIERLSDNGWTIVQMPGAAIRAIHMETGSIASGLAAEIVADSYATSPVSGKGELLVLHARVRALVDKALEQKDSRVWSETFDAVFSDNLSRRIRELLRQFDVDFEYYDPDMDYDDDVLAFWRAFDEHIQKLSAEGFFDN
jgi:hypothetical protein